MEYVHCDVSDATSAESCVDAAVERFGRVDILVNNAALYGDWDMGDQSFDYLKRVFDVNLHGVWLMTRAVAPQMVEQRYGRIVNQASAAAYNYRMPAGRRGVRRAERVQLPADEVGRRRPHEVLGCPARPMEHHRELHRAGRHRDRGDAERGARSEVVETLAEQQAVPGVLHADDLTSTAVFFASDEARFVTGQVLVVDGGKYMPA